MATTCSFCGIEINDGENVCSICGTPVKNVSAPIIEETPAPAAEEVKPEPADPVTEENKFVCTGCGKEYATATKFCAECGGKIEEKKPVAIKEETAPKFVCNGCGKEYPAGTKFCAECGGKIEEVKPAAPKVFACVGCGKEYPAGTKFCAECGGKIEEVKPAAPDVFACSECGKEYPAGTKFCAECGGKVAQKGNSAKESQDNVLYDIYLQDAGNNKVFLIKEIRSFTGCGLLEAKMLAETFPKYLKKGCSEEEAKAAEKVFKACGASVKILVSKRK